MLLRLSIVLLFVLLCVNLSMAQDDPTANPAEPITLDVWLPDILVPPDSDTSALLAEQTASFEANETNISINRRLKRVGDVGGIMSTMRSASIVASGALPDITLLRRNDLVIAEREGLIQPMEGLVTSSVVGNLSATLKLGQINGTLYGLPYMLELPHIAYRVPEEGAYEQWNFETFLARGVPFMFPAGRIAGLNDVFLVQYMAAGGAIAPDSTLILNEDALQTVLRFYEDASDADIITGFALNYSAPQDYLSAFLSETYDIGVFSSTTYLSLDDTLQPATIPTPDGRPVSLLNGWVWVIITSDPAKQAVATRYITWLMDSTRQAEYASSISMIPSQPEARRNSLSESDQAFYTTLIANSILPLTDGEGGTLTRAMQQALASVLTKERNAEDALNRVIEEVLG